MTTLKAGMVYFLMVFGAGFILGPIRILWAVPRFGMRMAELMEIPLIIAVIFLAAGWVVRRFKVPPGAYNRLSMGCLALGSLLIVEFTLVLWLQGISLGEYFANRDPVSGTAYWISLGIFAIMPVLVKRR